MITPDAVVRNVIPGIAPNGTKILSVDGALAVMQATERLLQQNLPIAEVMSAAG
jgi:hypothetical protein